MKSQHILKFQRALRGALGHAQRDWRPRPGRFSLLAVLVSSSLALIAAVGWASTARLLATHGVENGLSETSASIGQSSPVKIAYKQAGLSERQAAAHLLDRLAFGPRPGEVDEVVAFGLDRWIEAQLSAALPDEQLSSRMEPLDAWAMSAAELQERFVDPAQIARQLVRSNRQGSEMTSESEAPEDLRQAMRQKARTSMREAGQRPGRVLTDQLFASRMLRAIYSENQLAEVLTDFWFNHFNVDAGKRESRNHLLSYERDAIRPNVLGSFSTLVSATATHPAMLLYLDNARSRAEPDRRTLVDVRAGDLRAQATRRGRNPSRSMNTGRARSGGQVGGRSGAMRTGQSSQRMRPGQRGRQLSRQDTERRGGLNENYARELMELHTLGVDGGYSQDDVIDVARAFTGWTVLPATGPRREEMERRLPNQAARSRLGFYEKDDFFFNAAFHDAEKKTVLGTKIASGGGIEDGYRVLELLAQHSSTARHVSNKLAQRFVSDTPSDELVARMANAFEKTSGDIAVVMRTMVESEEFWRSRRQKIKMPFELVVSSVRALNADVANPGALGQWLERMGQPLYRYQAPTGFPETADHWVNAGGLLNRMNFGLEAARGLRGTSVDLLDLVGGREPESTEQALRWFAEILMPAREIETTVEALLPAARDGSVAAEVARRSRSATEARPGDSAKGSTGEQEDLAGLGDLDLARSSGKGSATGTEGTKPMNLERHHEESTTAVALEHLVGLLLGSPEFQRR